MRRFVCSVLALLLIASAGGCSLNPATGESSFTAFMSPAEERRVGTEQHPQLVKQFGGAYEDAELAAYVDSIGQKLARSTELPDETYSFTVLDDELINAFALPGGYVHVTRGLLALASNEAEMAGVLAHELGHITARHAAERYSQGVLAGIGTIVLGVAGAVAGVPGVGEAAGAGAQAYLQSYSREQELEADMLGIRYMSRAGYDPAAMASFFKKVDAFTELQATIAGDPSAADRFSIMASHPRTGDRVEQAIKLADANTPSEPIVGEEIYLSRIDGIIYGDSPEQGVRRGRDFAHPDLRIAFQVPPGFVMINFPSSLSARGPAGSAMVFDMENPQKSRSVRDIGAYLTQEWANGIRLRQAKRETINGMPAAIGVAQVATRGGPVDLTIAAIRERRDRIYRFVFLTPPKVTRDLGDQILQTVRGFGRLSQSEAEAIKPLRLDVDTAINRGFFGDLKCLRGFWVYGGPIAADLVPILVFGRYFPDGGRTYAVAGRLSWNRKRWRL